jgi:Fe-S cluster biosynthesis and repair protein YggX
MGTKGQEHASQRNNGSEQGNGHVRLTVPQTHGSPGRLASGTYGAWVLCKTNKIMLFFPLFFLRFFMARMVQCIKLGKEAEGLDFPPYPGELGKRIWESVSKEAWAAWIKHQTMLVNENRLNLADLRARQYLARQMENHFFGEGADAAQGYVPPSA